MRAITFRRFIQEEESLSWLVEGLLPSVGWTLLVGKRGLGKTTFALQLAMSLQEGRPFLGLTTTQTRILYLQADSLTDEWREIVRERFPNSDALTVVDVEQKCLDNTTYVEDLGKIIQRFKPGFVVFDSLYNLTGKNINTDQIGQVIAIMKSVCRFMDRDGVDKMIPFLLIHHPPHEQSRASGHNSLEGSPSNLWYLFANKLQIAKGRVLKEKGKDILMKRGEETGLWEVKMDKSKLTEQLAKSGLVDLTV